jgi:hypothetical protein
VDVMRILIFVLVCMFCLPIAAMARRDMGPPEWTFNDAADLNDWQNSHNLSPISGIEKVKDTNGIERSVIEIESTGDDPYIYPGGFPPSWEPFSGYEYGIIYIGAQVEETDTWQIDYITGKSGSYNEDESRRFVVPGKPGFVDIEFRMNWEYMIRGFRIHPVKVSQPIKRLATTWGGIKDLF